MSQYLELSSNEIDRSTKPLMSQNLSNKCSVVNKFLFTVLAGSCLLNGVVCQQLEAKFINSIVKINLVLDQRTEGSLELFKKSSNYAKI
ncbi:hypothetical protein NPIL_290481 [Nephila pilipes]|uniref:Uncharacterized protein n=1 Tax=Nephila pilipes TaxID=299642 RepID=A0A8X6P3H9_NEPPI|nr:hypothetical protein NPIL_290481 [Nephila pilipes]